MKNEKWLIDADSLIKKTEKSRNSHPVGSRLRDHYNGILGYIKYNAKYVDAVEVVHGRWNWNEENECWVCSNCEMSALNNYRGISTESNYCPNCGAKMDGGNEDG